jgi:CheY-like chemotaxis protein
MAAPSGQTIPVLVVDDDEGFLRVASSVLADSPSDFAVSTVRSGTDAVAFLERQPPFADAPRPAFVILDLRLPDMDAPEVLSRLAAHGTLGDLPVLVVSQADWAEDEAALRQAGATAFRTKPSRVAALRDIVLGFWRDHVATAGSSGSGAPS